jgi:hypothetical protein
VLALSWKVIRTEGIGKELAEWDHLLLPLLIYHHKVNTRGKVHEDLSAGAAWWTKVGII